MNDFWKQRRILPTITTTAGSNWREKIEEVKRFELKEVSIFPTCLKIKERKKLYNTLRKTKVKKIPLVHLRSDMELWELDYLIENYGTEAFNIHSQAEYPLIYDYSKYKNIIYVENVYQPYDEEEIKNFGGICLDFSHLENDRILAKEKFNHNMKIIEKYPIGSNHVSAVRKTTQIDEAGYLIYGSHLLEDFSELDYLKKYPLNYFSPFIAIELENKIEKQLEIKEYLTDLLKDK